MNEKELFLKQIKIVKRVVKAYHSILRRNNFFPSYNQELSFYDSISNVCKQHLPSEKFILAVETSYFSLQPHLRKILKSDFFYNNFPFWWEHLYSRRQYYRFKQEAVSKFNANLVKTKALTTNGSLNYENN